MTPLQKRLWTILGCALLTMPLCAQPVVDARPQPPQPPEISAREWTVESDEGIRLEGIQAPFTLYDALWRRQRIGHPYDRQQSDSVQWVEKNRWRCELTFEADPAQAARRDGRIVFQQIMTHARVFLNGTLLGSINNAFHPFGFDTGDRIVAGTNRLVVELLPIQALNDSLSAAHPIPLPEGHRVFVRQPAYTFGWDWGPRLAAGGITGKVHMEWSNVPRITQLTHRVVRADTGLAEIEVEARIRGAAAGTRVRLHLTGHGCSAQQIQPMLGRADTLFRARMVVPNPRLWWTHDLGQPHLYRLTATLYLPHEPDDDPTFTPATPTLGQNVGLRTLEHVQTPDERGSSYHFQLNGHPLFVRGANLVPTGYLTDGRTNDRREAGHDWGRRSEKETLIRARDAHCNLIRAWGGGNYPTDEFYDSADSLGILVWQDAAFACAMYPSDTAFLDAVKTELQHHIRRLRTHPSLAIWCGNNENYEGWLNWGWQKSLKYSADDSQKVWNGYEKLFIRSIPRWLQELDPGRPYIHSSPLTGWGRPEAYRTGDVHYWGVWWGMDSLENYTRKVGRFVSEYGMQSFPHIATMRQFAGNAPHELHPSAPAMKHHQRHPTGASTLEQYLNRDYPPASNPEHYAYLTRLLQLRAMETAIKAHRMAKPYCMGTLFWQWTDAWPGISWSAIDYFGRPKALFHRLKTLYHPIWIDIDTAVVTPLGNHPPGRPRLVAVNDTRQPLEVEVELQLWHNLASKPIRISRKKFVLSHSAALSHPWPRSVLSDKRLKKPGYFVSIAWSHGGAQTTGNWWIPQRPLHQTWPDPGLQVRAIGMGLLEVRSSRPARHIHLNMDSQVDDDYFDLLPGQTKIVKFIPHYAETYPPRVAPITFYDLGGVRPDTGSGPER